MTRRDRIAARQSGQAILMGALAIMLLSISVVSGLRYVGPKVSLQSQSQVSSVTGLAASASIPQVRHALASFVARNFRLPCPADGTAPTGGTGKDSTSEGIEDCKLVSGGSDQANAFRGVVPWKTLGLAAAAGQDGYQRRIGYAVSAALVAGTPFNSAPPPVTQNSIPVSVNGAASNCGKATNCAYVLISYGADGAGGWLLSGNQLAAPSSTTYEYPNTLASAYKGTGAIQSGSTCSSATTTFQVCPTFTTSGSTSYFDDTLAFEDAYQICQDANGNRAPANWVTCSTNGTGGPQTSSQNTNSAATSANSGTIINTSCPAGNYCPGSTNAGSLANTFAFVGGGSSSLVGASSLSLVAGLGTVSVSGSNANGISASGVQVGNSPVGQNGDWIGANTLNSCAACWGSSWTPNYTIPGEEIVYNFTNSYYSFGFAAYLVDGGMQIRVDGYLSSNEAITGNAINGATTVTGVSSTTGINIGESAEGSSTYSSLLPGGTTITGIIAGTPAQITLSQPINLTQSTGSFYIAASGTSFTSLLGTTTSGSTSITNASTVSGLAAGQNIAGLGLSSGVSITAVGSNGLTISQAATASETSTPLFATPSADPIKTITGTVSSSAPMSVTSVSSTAGLAVGQVVAGLGVPSGTTITHVNSGNSSLSLSKSLEPAAASTTINVVANSFTVTGNVTSGSTTVSNLSSTSGLYAGMMVSGSGIPDGTYISCLLAQGCSSTATLSNAATATVTADTLFITPWTKVGTMVIGNSAAGNINNGIDFTGDLTAGSTAIANVASAAYLSDIGVSAGAPLAGYGVAPGTTVSAIAANGITMSQAAVASVTTQSLIVQPAALIVSPFTGTVTAGSKAVTSLSSSAGLSTNMLIEGVGLATGLSITSVSSTGLSLSSSATLSATGDSFFVSPRIPVTGITGTETFGSTVLSGLSSVSSLAIGDFITGFGIPAGTLITSVSAGLSSSTSLSISISNPATASQSNVAFIAGYYPPLTATAMTGSLNGTQGIVASSSALPFVGEVLAAANLPSSTIVSSVAGTTLGLTQSASASLSSTTFYPTFAPCPGPAKKIGTTTPNGLYGAPNALIGVYGGSSDPAPIAQHSGATAAASINSQIWPQPGTANTGLGSATSNPNSLQGNYIDQRDNQFYNRMFTDSYGTPLKFNVLVFQVLPYVYPTKPTTYSTVNSTCTTDTLGRVVCQYGMLFEGAKACYTDSYSASCTMTGNDEWWNPPVAETQDCGQDPS